MMVARYAGRPFTTAGQAVLFDSGEAPGVLAGEGTLRWLTVLYAVTGRNPLPPGVAVVLEVNGVARRPVPLAYVARQGGYIRLNARMAARYGAGRRVQLLLLDPDGDWADAAPEMEVLLT